MKRKVPRYSEQFKQMAVNDVKNGLSYYAVGKKYNVCWQTVQRWCSLIGVKSQYTKGFQTKVTDDSILNTIKKHKAMTFVELQKKFNLSSCP